MVGSRRPDELHTRGAQWRSRSRRKRRRAQLLLAEYARPGRCFRCVGERACRRAQRWCAYTPDGDLRMAALKRQAGLSFQAGACLGLLLLLPASLLAQAGTSTLYAQATSTLLDRSFPSGK